MACSAPPSWNAGCASASAARQNPTWPSPNKSLDYALGDAPLAVALLAIVLAAMACGQPQGAATPAGAAVPAGYAGQHGISTAAPPSLTRTPVPAPVATYAIPPITPNPNPSSKPTPAQTLRGEPAPRPEDPLNVTAYPLRVPNTAASTRYSTVVLIGTVMQVLPARWTTPDGRRPANPHDRTKANLIYVPVLVEVEQYLKGQQSQRQLLLFAGGGTVGQDSMTRIDHLDEFQEGERVVLFLFAIGHEPRAFNGRPLWDIDERYTVTPSGLATNYYRTVPLQQLLDEIAAALRQA